MIAQTQVLREGRCLYCERPELEHDYHVLEFELRNFQVQINRLTVSIANLGGSLGEEEQ